MKHENPIETDYLNRVRVAHTNHKVRVRDFHKALNAKQKEIERMGMAIIAEFEADIESSLSAEDDEIKLALKWRREHEVETK